MSFWPDSISVDLSRSGMLQNQTKPNQNKKTKPWKRLVVGFYDTQTEIDAFELDNNAGLSDLITLSLQHAFGRAGWYSTSRVAWATRY